MPRSEDDSRSEQIETRSIDELARSIEQASDGSYAFLVGAGVSRPEPAAVPTATEIIERFQNELHEQLTDNEVDLQEWADEFEEENISDGESRYGFWFTKARPTPGNRREEIEEIVEGADPPFGQIILASMMDKGIISHTITPNFDNLLFKSSYQYANKRPFLIDHQAKAPQFRLSDDRAAIVKVHGDYLHYTQNTAEETAKLDENIRDLFQQTINEYGIVVVGYGGNDDSLMNVLESEPFSEHGLFWCQREGSTLPDRVVDLLSSSENSYLVWIDGSESLFGTLWSDIGRVSLPQPDEITERAKRRRDRVQQRKNEYLGEEPLTASKGEEDGAEIKSVLWEARNAVSEDDYELAINILNDTIQDDNVGGEIYYYRGYIHTELEEFDQAIDDFEQAIERNPEMAAAYNNRGYAYFNLEEFDRAIEDYDQAISLDPEKTGAFVKRGIAYSNLDEYQQAIEDFNRAIELEPESYSAYNRRGIVYVNIGEYAQAIEDFNRAIELDPKRSGAHLNKTECLIKNGELQEAKKSAEKALENSDNLNNIASSLMLLLITKTLLGQDVSKEMSRYENICSESFTSTWSFGELEEWLAAADLNEEVDEEIRDIIDRLREHTD